MSEDVPRYGATAESVSSRVDELQALLAEIGGSQRGAAELLEMNPRTLRYYVSGQHEVPQLVLFALRYLVSEKKIIENAGLAPYDALAKHFAELEQKSKGNR